jgi:hypothetical protein
MEQFDRLNTTVPEPAGLRINIQQHRNGFWANLGPLVTKSLRDRNAHARSREEYLSPRGSKQLD